MTATALAATALVARKNDFVLSGPVGSFDAYMDKVSRIPVLSRHLPGVGEPLFTASNGPALCTVRSFVAP